MRMANGTWPVPWLSLSQALCYLGVNKTFVLSKVWLQLCDPAQGRGNLTLSFALPRHLSLDQIEPGNFSCHLFCLPQPCPTWILRSKHRPIYIVSSSPWAKVKGFALTASENTGLAWDLAELSYYTAPMFQIQLLSILSYETFWKKRWNSSMGGAGHLFQAFCLAALLYSHFPPLKMERNIGFCLWKHLTSYTLFCVSLKNNNKC